MLHFAGNATNFNAAALVRHFHLELGSNKFTEKNQPSILEDLQHMSRLDETGMDMSQDGIEIDEEIVANFIFIHDLRGVQ